MLLFCLMIAGAAFLAFLLYGSFRRYEPPHVAVAQTPEEAKPLRRGAAASISKPRQRRFQRDVGADTDQKLTRTPPVMLCTL